MGFNREERCLVVLQPRTQDLSSQKTEGETLGTRLVVLSGFALTKAAIKLSTLHFQPISGPLCNNIVFVVAILPVYYQI
jgi:hypothetical protein